MHQPLCRRTVLKAAGVTLALPLLESMNRAIGRETVTSPRRMVLICTTLGFHSPSWFPEKTGVDYDNSEYLEILKEHRSDFTLFSGLSHPDQNGKQPHDTELTWLTAARNPGLGGFKNTVSLDQVVANRLGSATRFPSLALSTRSQKSQSYTENGVMLPAEDRPSAVFSKLFLEGTESQVRRQRRQLQEGRSILDRVLEQARAVERKGSQQDRRQLEDYFAAIRQAEVELAKAEAWLDRPKPKVEATPPRDISDASDLLGRTRALFNLIPLTLQTDSTRVLTLVIQDHLVVPKIEGVSAEHHNLSHHGQDPTKIKQLKRIESGLLKCHSELLSAMKQAIDGDQRLLDQTSVLLGSNLGNANAHDPRNLPILLAGGGCSHGRHVAFDSKNNTPLCNLFVGLLQQMGLDEERFGTSNGIVDVT
jgi:hypothetical protein